MDSSIWFMGGILDDKSEVENLAVPIATAAQALPVSDHENCIYVLNEEQWAHFVETMTTPREPTEFMKQAAKRFDELVQRKKETGTPAAMSKAK